jgi:hypothetical protein
MIQHYLVNDEKLAVMDLVDTSEEEASRVFADYWCSVRAIWLLSTTVEYFGRILMRCCTKEPCRPL